MASMQEAIRRLTLQFRSDGADKAVRDLRQLQGAQEGVTVASQKNERATLSLERRTESIQRQYDRTYRSAKTMEKVERDLDRARAQGLISARRQSELLRLAEAHTNGATAATGRYTAALSGLTRVAGGFAAVVAGGGFLRMADASTRIENSLRISGLEGAELQRVYDRLYESANRNVAPLEALVQLYGRASLVQGELGVSSEQLLQFTDKVALALRVSGRSAQESSGALLQLSQALGSGTVRAEELNSLLEGTPAIAQAVAAGLAEAGGSVARLRQLVVDGKVSSQALFAAFGAGAVILEDRVAKAELTVSDQFTRLQNVLMDAAGKFDEVAGAGTRAQSGIGAVASAIEGLVKDRDRLEDFVVLVERLAGATAGAVVGGRIAGPVGAIVGGAAGSFSPEIFDRTQDLRREMEALAGATEHMQAGVAAGLIPQSAVDNSLRYLAELRRELARTEAATKLIPASGPISLGGWPARVGGGSGRPAVNPVTLADYPLSGGANDKLTRDAKRAQDAIDGVIASLRHEEEQLGRNARQQAVANALKQAGITIDHARGKEVADAAASTYDAVTAQEALNDRIREGTTLIGGFAEALIGGMTSGKGALSSLASSMSGLLSKGVSGVTSAVGSSVQTGSGLAGRLGLGSGVAGIVGGPIGSLAIGAAGSILGGNEDVERARTAWAPMAEKVAAMPVWLKAPAPKKETDRDDRDQLPLAA